MSFFKYLNPKSSKMFQYVDCYLERKSWQINIIVVIRDNWTR
jgi:hypothetical protein